MSKPRKGKSAEITFEQAIAELQAAEEALREESAEYSQAYEQSVRELHRLQTVMARERARSLSAQLRVDRLRAVVDKGNGNGEGKASIIYRLVDNPMITQGLLDAVANGEVETKHEASQIAAINQTLLVGGLARVKGKYEAQFLAASRYCHLYERSQIGAARATDYTQVRVDTSGPQQDQISAAQDDARAELDGARKALGERAASIMDIVVVGGASVRALAVRMGHGEGGSARRRAERELLQACDVLVDYFELMPIVTRGLRENGRDIAFWSYQFPKSASALDRSKPFPFPSPLGDLCTYGDLNPGNTNTVGGWDTTGLLMLSNHEVYKEVEAIAEANRLAEAELTTSGSTPWHIRRSWEAFDLIWGTNQPDVHLKRYKQFLQHYAGQSNGDDDER